MGCRQSRIAAAVHAMVQEEWTAKQQGFSLHIWRIAAYWSNTGDRGAFVIRPIQTIRLSASVAILPAFDCQKAAAMLY